MAARRKTRPSIRRANGCPDRALRAALRRELLSLAVDMGENPMDYFEEAEDGGSQWGGHVVEAAQDMLEQNILDDGVNYTLFVTDDPVFRNATPEQVLALLPEVAGDIVREVDSLEAAVTELGRRPTPPRDPNVCRCCWQGDVPRRDLQQECGNGCVCHLTPNPPTDDPLLALLRGSRSSRYWSRHDSVCQACGKGSWGAAAMGTKDTWAHVECLVQRFGAEAVYGGGMAQNPGDEGRRRVERGAAAAGDPVSRAKALVARMRAGELHSANVSFAARLGDEAAKLLAPDAPPIMFLFLGPGDLEFARELMGDQRMAAWLLECAAHVGSRIGLSSQLGRALAKADRWSRGAGPPLEPEDVAPQRGTSANERDRRAVQQVLYAIFVMFNMPDPSPAENRRTMAAVHGLELCREAAGWFAQRKQHRLAEKLQAQGGGRQHELFWQTERLAQYLLGEE